MVGHRENEIPRRACRFDIFKNPVHTGFVIATVDAVAVVIEAQKPVAVLEPDAVRAARFVDAEGLLFAEFLIKAV